MVVHGADKTAAADGCPPPPRTTPTGRRPCGWSAGTRTSSSTGPRRLRPRPRSPTEPPRKVNSMASIKIAYVGGGSSRAAGTMASLLAHGKEFDGSHVVLIDRRPGPPGPGGTDREEAGPRPGARHHGGDDHRPAGRTDRRRRGAVQLPAGRLRAAPGRRADPDAARRDRPGDPGPRRDDDVVPVDPGDPEHPRRPGRRRAGSGDLQLHQPGQHRLPGRHPAQRPADLLDVRRADDLLAADPARRPGWIPTGPR